MSDHERPANAMATGTRGSLPAIDRADRAAPNCCDPATSRRIALADFSLLRRRALRHRTLGFTERGLVDNIGSPFDQRFPGPDMWPPGCNGLSGQSSCVLLVALHHAREGGDSGCAYLL